MPKIKMPIFKNAKRQKCKQPLPDYLSRFHPGLFNPGFTPGPPFRSHPWSSARLTPFLALIPSVPITSPAMRGGSCPEVDVANAYKSGMSLV